MSAHSTSKNFYRAESSIITKPKKALKLFEKVLIEEENLIEKRFSYNSASFIIMLSDKLENYEKIIETTEKLFSLHEHAKQRDQEVAIEIVSNCLQSDQPDFTLKMVKLILELTKGSQNQYLWFDCVL